MIVYIYKKSLWQIQLNINWILSQENIFWKSL